jgi:ribose 5-phosphate isomerase B
MSDPSKKIGLAADHAGFSLKNLVAAELRRQGYEVLDLGAHSEDKVDYPDYGYALAEEIAKGTVTRGIAACGSGIGISIALNRNLKVRAALCQDVTSARLARQHNDANVLVMGARVIGPEAALDCVRMFLNTPFEGGRHEGRVQKLGQPKC